MRDSNIVSEQLVATAQESKNGNLVSILYNTEDNIYRYIYYRKLGEYRLCVTRGKIVKEESILRRGEDRLKQGVLRMVRNEELEILYVNEDYIASEELLSEFI